MKTIIANLKRQIKINKKYGHEPNEASWGYETGILISTKEAELILSRLTGKSALSAKIELIEKDLTDKKIRELNPIWVRDEIIKRLKSGH